MKINYEGVEIEYKLSVFSSKNNHVKLEVGEFIFNRMNDVVVSTAKMFRGEAELIKLLSVLPLINDINLSKEVTSYVEDLIGKDSVILLQMIKCKKYGKIL